MFNLLNPLKWLSNLVSMTLTLLLLGYTHTQAFKLGASIHQKPLLEKTAQVLGILPETSEPTDAPPTKDRPLPLITGVLEWFEDSTDKQP